MARVSQSMIVCHTLQVMSLLVGFELEDYIALTETFAEGLYTEAWATHLIFGCPMDSNGCLSSSWSEGFEDTQPTIKTDAPVWTLSETQKMAGSRRV